MKAMDVMVHDVITIGPDASVAAAAKLIAQNDVSALPVVDHLVGIISDGDLIPGEFDAMTPAAMLAKFAKSHGKRVEEVMSATEETPLAEIAAILERKPIKRVPIVRDGQSREVLEPRH